MIMDRPKLRNLNIHAQIKFILVIYVLSSAKIHFYIKVFLHKD